MNKNKYLQYYLAMALVIGGASTAVRAQTVSTSAGPAYPTKPVRFVIAFPPGGPSDILSRLVGGKLAENFGQSFVFDNRPGAGGNIAGEITAKSPADGYTLLMGNNSILATNAALYKNMGFDPVKELAPVTLVASQPNILVVHPTVAAKSVKEFIAYAKAQAGKLNYASSGSGAAAHLSAELFKTMTGVRMTHVPYKGGGPALIDVLAGQCQLMFATALAVQPYLQSQRLRPLAVTTAKRMPTQPDLPTVAEAGVPGFEATTWHGVVAPAGTPPAVIAKLHGEISKILQTPEVSARLSVQGAEIVGGGPQMFAAYIQSEIPKWTKVIKDSGARAD
ncbi:MAG TPA: tripartite tricarboxylate transporter substrate binding protein [Burkholderiales bacterium]|nr:tripartite tricarboxylate transporter substrate binding protein [Burkholderiales bacterium]